MRNRAYTTPPNLQLFLPPSCFRVLLTKEWKDHWAESQALKSHPGFARLQVWVHGQTVSLTGPS